ncbi:MAG: hypothetical protein HZC28_19085 [Spirochaetes bacterium]|nr:hypothetical protein [Spirochaetota bacterium]
MTRRERVLNAVNFRPVDRTPKDLGGMNSTGISAFAYPNLVKALGLPYRRPRIHDTGQMLAMPDIDILDALDCDVVHAAMDSHTNAFPEPEKWKPYGFNGRLDALVRQPEAYKVHEDGTITMNETLSMPPASHVFDSAHGGQPLDLTGELPHPDLNDMKKSLSAQVFTDERIRAVEDYLKRVRSSTDRAVMFNGLQYGLGYPHGIAAWSMLCLTDPDYVKARHDIVIEHAITQMKRLLPAIAPYVDIIMASSDDQGTQQSSILPPDTYRELYTPYYRRANDAAHRLAPDSKIFLHSCGAIYDLIDSVIEGGFDILNPVQWSAGKHGFREWKDKCRGRISLWGGGVNTQTTLPLGTVNDVKREAAEAASYLSGDSGFVFCAIHNLLAEIPPEKIIAMYQAV